MTKLSPIARKFFRKEDDDVVRFRKTDQGQTAEPQQYLPPAPLLLMNGSVGIGTGWSTNIPMHDPLDVVEATKCVVLGRDITFELVPKVTGWNGTTLFERDPDSNGIVQTVWVGKYSVQRLDPSTCR